MTNPNGATITIEAESGKPDADIASDEASLFTGEGVDDASGDTERQANGRLKACWRR